jgi:hypothetical protein
MKYLILALTLASCVPTAKQDAPIEVVPTPQELVDKLLAIDPAKFPETPHWAVPEYEQIILETLKLFPVKQLPCSPIVTFKGIVNAESSFKKSSRYLESFGVYSIGLMQLSVSDEKRYFCGFKTEADVINPIRNLYCGVKVFHTLENKYPKESFYEYGGRYFSTLRWDRYPVWKGKTQSGWNRVRDYWKKNGCLVK